MKILIAASEVAPFAKSGGLGDVTGALPKYLNKKNIDVNVALPLYRTIKDKHRKKMEKIADFEVSVNWRKQYCGIWALDKDGINYYFIENEYYFGRENFYGYFDDGERFVFFSKAIIALLNYLGDSIDIVHSHDWQTALINVYMDLLHKEGFQDKCGTVFTIHNLKYQGRFDQSIFQDLLDLPSSYFSNEGLEFYNDVNFMKGGICFADQVTTVSNNYSQEIRTEYFGEGLEGILKAREKKLSGIINGLDYSEYNPMTDKNVFTNFRSSFEKKIENKLSLQDFIGFRQDKDVPLFSLISRFTEQKGLDLLLHIMNELMSKDLQLVVLGNGEKYYEKAFLNFAERFPDKCKVIIGFKESLARKIYVGSDIFLMPSRFEPCGISQMISLSYGTIPIVRETGGLKDTVEPFNEFTGLGNGFSFRNYNAYEFMSIIDYALSFYYQKDIWHKIFKNAIKSRFTWEDSAEQYIEIYSKILKKRNG